MFIYMQKSIVAEFGHSSESTELKSMEDNNCVKFEILTCFIGRVRAYVGRFLLE